MVLTMEDIMNTFMKMNYAGLKLKNRLERYEAIGILKIQIQKPTSPEAYDS